jgi:WD40 repeat protein
VPFSRREDFVGRDDDLWNLHVLLSRAGPMGIRPVGATGMGGIGKTQLAVEYAYRYQNAYSAGVFWINAAESFDQGFARLGRTLQPESAERPHYQQVRAAFTYLRRHPDALLILDNVAEPAELNQPLGDEPAPAALPCRVLFTTRRRDLGRFRPLEVSVLPEQPAIQLLLSHPSRQPAWDPVHPEHPLARKICAMLGWLPLALEIGGAFLGQWADFSLADFLARLQAEGCLPVLYDEAEHLSLANLSFIHAAAVEATLKTQWDALLDDAVRLLLRVAGQFPEASAIPRATLGLLANIPDRHQAALPSPLARALKQLQDASLVEGLHDDRVRLHPLVREFAARQTPEEEAASFRRACANNLAAAYADSTVLEDHARRRSIDAVQEDLSEALSFVSRAGGPANLELQSLLRLVKREAHNLRQWDRMQHPAYFTQQVHNRAIALALPELADRTASRLAHLSHPSLDLLWCSRDSAELERILAGDAGLVSAVVVMPDGGRAVSASGDGTLRVWDLTTGRALHVLSGHAQPVNAVAVTADGGRAVSASDDGTLRAWDLATGRALHVLTGHVGRVNAVAVTPDSGRAVSASDDNTIRVWDLATGQALHPPFVHGDLVTAVAVTPGGGRAVSASGDGTLRAWDLATGQALHVLTGHAGRVNAVVVTPDGGRAVSASDDGTLRVWDLDAGQALHVLTGHAGRVNAVVVTPDGGRAVSASDDGTLRVWDLEAGRVLHALTGHEQWVSAVAVTPDGGRAVSGSRDKTVRVWDLSTGRALHVFAGHAQPVSAVAVTPAGGRAVSASWDSTLRVWDLATDQALHAPAGHANRVTGVAVTPAGGRAVSASWDGTLRVWDLATGQALHGFSGHTGRVNAVAVTPGSDRAVSGSWDSTVRVWDLATGRALHVLTGHEGRVNAVAVTPDGGRAVSASDDGTLRAWDLATGRAQHVLTGHVGRVNAVAVTPDGGRAVSASDDGTLRVWDLDAGQALHVLTGHGDTETEEMRYEEPVSAVVVTPDGGRAVSASWGGTLRVWDLATGRALRTLTGHAGLVSAVAATQDGRRAVSASADNTIRVWDLKREVLAIASLDRRATCLSLAPDGITIVVGDEAGSIYCLIFADRKGSILPHRVEESAGWE